VTLSVEQIRELNRSLATLRHDINNQLSLIAAAAEIIRFNPDMAKRMAEGHSKLEAIRCLKRYIAREVFTLIGQRQREINQARITA